MKPAMYKRTDDPQQLAAMIKHFERQVQTRPNRRKLVKMRERLAKLVGPQPAEPVEVQS